MPPLAPTTKTMLIVEDNPATARALKTIFARRGWTVRLADTAHAADLALADPPDVIFLDLMLPDRNGEDILRRVRRDGFPSRVVVMTAMTHDCPRVEEVRNMRPDALIFKPMTLDQLIAACEVEPSLSPDLSP